VHWGFRVDGSDPGGGARSGGVGCVRVAQHAAAGRAAATVRTVVAACLTTRYVDMPKMGGAPSAAVQVKTSIHPQVAGQHRQTLVWGHGATISPANQGTIAWRGKGVVCSVLASSEKAERMPDRGLGSTQDSVWGVGGWVGWGWWPVLNVDFTFPVTHGVGSHDSPICVHLPLNRARLSVFPSIGVLLFGGAFFCAICRQVIRCCLMTILAGGRKAIIKMCSSLSSWWFFLFPLTWVSSGTTTRSMCGAENSPA